MESSSASCDNPTGSPTLFRKPEEINSEMTNNKRFYGEKNEKELEITEIEIRILNFLYDKGIKFCSPFEKMFDYYEKIQKPKGNSENSADFTQKNKKIEEKIKLNSVLYLKRKNSFKNTTKE